MTLFIVSCSQISLSDQAPLPNSITYIKTIYFPVTPRIIRYCSFTNTFLVIDNIKNFLYRIDMQGKITQRIGEFGFEKGQFVHIADIAVDDFGNVFIVDDVENLIIQFDEFGQYVNSFSPMDIYEPKLIAVQNTGELLVYDSNTNQILCFSKNNSIRFRFGKFHLTNPSKICAAMDVNFIADTGNNTVFIIDTFGGLLSEIRPKNILVDMSSTKNFFFLLDTSSHLFVGRNTSSQLLDIGSLNTLSSMKKSQSLIALGTQIAIVDANMLYFFQLVTN